MLTLKGTVCLGKPCGALRTTKARLQRPSSRSFERKISLKRSLLRNHVESRDSHYSTNNEPDSQQIQDPSMDEDDNEPQRPKLFRKMIGNLFKMGNAILKFLAWLFSKPMFRLAVFSTAIFGSHMILSSRRGYTLNVLYSEFVKQIESGKVERVCFESKSNKIRFYYNQEMWDDLRSKLSSTTKLAPADIERRVSRIKTCTKMLPVQTDSLTNLLDRKNVQYGVIEPGLMSVLSTLVSTLFWVWVPLLPVMFLLMRSVDKNLGGKSHKVQKNKATTNVCFDDIAGLDDAKRELMEVVDLLKDPDKYAKLNAKIPAGVLLCGETGTGKTLLARAVAGEAGVPFFAVSASEFVEMFVGRGAARIRELFREARRHTPCVVFIDEIDSVGGKRGAGLNEERDQTLNQLLVELDGFEDNHSIVLLAATNRLSSLDSALLRPGRLTRKINVPLPDEEGRAAILAVHLRDVPMDSEKARACGFIAQLSSGFSGAELANTVNEAALMAARDGREIVEVRDLIQGLSRTKGTVNPRRNVPRWLSSLQQSFLDESWRQTGMRPS